jgi:Arc/MetJ-type ribon-helix-helix transcriptional regulator
MRHITAADLPENIARLAEAQVAAGRFQSVEDVVCAGVEAIAERVDAEKEWLAYARKEAEDAFAELDRGESIRGTPMELMALIDAEVARQAGTFRARIPPTQTQEGGQHDGSSVLFRDLRARGATSPAYSRNRRTPKHDRWRARSPGE